MKTVIIHTTHYYHTYTYTHSTPHNEEKNTYIYYMQLYKVSMGRRIMGYCYVTISKEEKDGTIGHWGEMHHFMCKRSDSLCWIHHLHPRTRTCHCQIRLFLFSSNFRADTFSPCPSLFQSLSLLDSLVVVRFVGLRDRQGHMCLNGCSCKAKRRRFSPSLNDYLLTTRHVC